MRIVITGATGNVGTALLDVLESDADELIGVARRLPDTTSARYRAASWCAQDLGEPDAGTKLAVLLEGADAVVHLAWAISPERGDPPMWRSNDHGTRHVLDAVVAAGVPRVVVLSSVAAYAPAPRWRKVTESWPCKGIETSAYSRGKAALETLLDRFEANHPEVGVARLRPCAILQQRAAGEFQRWLLGPALPARLVGDRWLPLPLWKDLRAQAVHSADVAEAIRLVLDSGFTGAVNLAGPGVLDADALAGLLGGIRVPAPRKLVRAAAYAAWRTGVLPLHPGWLDLADGAPLVDTTLAETELGWRPRYDAASVVADLVAGLRSGAGEASPPLAPPRGDGLLPRLRSLTRFRPSHRSQS
ncbi:NAD-dependent epimerase/dehydratase family protein [Amycolatopsis thailandensis]|uniref:NAD-dependent epimerase/dehydratase family protein n=1 Tax=Amycolatopsis thailandensis TaxID=589330 RepID=UPI003638B3A9